jgi:hypothetical protein
MKARVVRLGLVAAIAAGVAAPLTSHAAVCSPEFQPVCYQVAVTCNDLAKVSHGLIACAIG